MGKVSLRKYNVKNIYTNYIISYIPIYPNKNL